MEGSWSLQLGLTVAEQLNTLQICNYNDLTTNMEDASAGPGEGNLQGLSALIEILLLF